MSKKSTASVLVIILLVVAVGAFLIFGMGNSKPTHRPKSDRGEISVEGREDGRHVRFSDNNRVRNFVKGSPPIDVRDQNSYDFQNHGTPGFQGLPVPAGSLRETNEDYRGTWGWSDSHGSDGTISNPGGFFRPYGGRTGHSTGFFGSASSFSPYPEIASAWEKVGLLTTTETSGPNVGKGVILNLFRRPIAPMHEVWEYRVEDRDGFFIVLPNQNEIRDGDEIPSVVGKGDLGPWKVSLFVKNKWIWV